MTRNMLFAIACVFLFGLLTFGCSAAPAAATLPYNVVVEVPKPESIDSAIIYFNSWTTITDKVTTPEVTRNDHLYETKIAYSEYLKGFVSWLHTDALEPWDGVIHSHYQPGEHPAAYLVVDLKQNNGKTLSFYSDGCYLYSADWSKRRKVDAQFRNYFDYRNRDMEIKISDSVDYKLCDY